MERCVQNDRDHLLPSGGVDRCELFPDLVAQKYQGGDRQAALEAAIRVSERVNGDRVLESLALSACYGRDTARSSGRKLPPTSSTRLRLWLFLVGLRSLHSIRRGVRSLECRNG